jgi:CubicO group peptidase (beta-lactamase class C family)
MKGYPRQCGWVSCIARLNLLLLVTHAALAAKSDAALPSPRPTAANLARIDELARNAISLGNIPGLSIAIERHGVTIYQKGFGYADLENNVPVTAETVFPLGSITKTMTGLAIQQLIHQGKVELDATAGHYLPNLPAPARNAKIRALLDHTSGIVGYTDIPDFPNNAQKSVSRDEIVSWFASRPLLFTPGSRWSYTNSGQYLLGLVIEAVSGESYSDYLQHHIFAPFGMKSATLEGWQPLIPHRAHGYRHGTNGLENAPRYDPLLPFAAGAVMSTASDLLKYRRGVFGAATSPAIRDQLLKQDRLDDGFLLPYSLGCLVIGDFEGHRRLGHPGDIYGFSAQYSYYPDDDITIAILTNTQDATFPPMTLEQKIVRVLLGIPAPTLRDAALSDSIARTLVGEYSVSDMRFGFDRIAFDVKDGHLWMALGGKGAPAVALRYQGPLHFISSTDDEQHIDFSPGDASTVTVSFYGSPLSMHRIAPPQP